MPNKILIKELPLSIIAEVYNSSQKKVKIDKYKVNTKDDRYLNFVTNGFKCANCGAEGKYATLECSCNQGNHLNVYTDEDVMLTKDHIYPKSKGGLDDIKNYQVLCEKCNLKKSDKSPITLVEALRNRQATKESVEQAVKSHRPKALIGV